MVHRLRGVAVVAALLTIGAAACSGDEAATAPSQDTGIATILADFSIKPAESEAPSGSITFDLVNEGPSDHAFALIRTDRAEDDLPTEDHVPRLDDLDVVAEVAEMRFGAERSLAVRLEAGSYVMACTIPGHYESDMHAAFSVT
jgi:uncharacterized cupredoxin-like copper-binding protein